MDIAVGPGQVEAAGRTRISIGYNTLGGGKNRLQRGPIKGKDGPVSLGGGKGRGFGFFGVRAEKRGGKGDPIRERVLALCKPVREGEGGGLRAVFGIASKKGGGACRPRQGGGKGESA